MPRTIQPNFACLSDLTIAFQCHTSIHNDRELENPSLFLVIDKAKISQVLRNLISNALKFSPPKSTITVRASLINDAVDGPKNSEGDAADYTHFRIEVVDQGVGMRPEDAQRLFGEVVQFDASKLQGGGGSGVGLYLSKGIMDLHSGRIGVINEALSLIEH